MGFPCWWALLFGALTGQLIFVGNLVFWAGLNRALPLAIASAVQRAVSFALREYLDEEADHRPVRSRGFPEPSGPPAGSVGVVLDEGNKAGWWVFVAGAVSVTTVIFLTCFCCYKGGCCRVERQEEVQLQNLPSDSPLSVKTIAHNQLAEIRLRRYGPTRALRPGGV